MSSRTLFLARLMGLYLLCVTLTMLTHKQAIVDIENALVHNPAMLYVGGIITMVAGLAVVLGHNIWRGGALPVVVTVTGWMMLLKGVFLILPNFTASFWEGMHFGQNYYLYASIGFVLGAYLTWAGFREAWHIGHPGHSH